MERRKWLEVTINGVGLLVAAAVAIPSLFKVLSPIIDEEEADDWRPVGPVSGFRMGITKASVPVSQEVVPNDLNQKGLFVWRKSDSDFVVYSRACTDLGCPVTYDSGSEWFFCPCHGGIFNKEGVPQAGPPNRPLWRYQTRIQNGVLEINLRSVPPLA